MKALLIIIYYSREAGKTFAIYLMIYFLTVFPTYRQKNTNYETFVMKLFRVKCRIFNALLFLAVLKKKSSHCYKLMKLEA